jgi:hypothetical protein
MPLFAAREPDAVLAAVVALRGPLPAAVFGHGVHAGVHAALLDGPAVAAAAVSVSVVDSELRRAALAAAVASDDAPFIALLDALLAADPGVVDGGG